MNDADILRAVQAAPLRTVRLEDAQGFGSNPWRSLQRLVDRGALSRLAAGIYTAPPDGQDGREWVPSLEAAALAIATARFGDRRVALMGPSAARFWGAIPRAIGRATVAITVAGRRRMRLPNGATITFVVRNLDALDVVRQPTELGMGLVTTRAQTLVDILTRPGLVGDEQLAADAVTVLRANADSADVMRIARRARRVSPRVRAVIEGLEADDGAAEA